MTVEGYCIPCRADVPVDAERTCLADGMVTIPPSYGKRTQQWVNGAWVPLMVKPEGWAWTPPRETAPTTVAKTPRGPSICGVCTKTFQPRRNGIPQRYCTKVCKNRALARRRWDAKRLAVSP